MVKYRADIDGLRSIAVIPVILFHLGFGWISGGYFGVDVFFVISGYLITSIIFREISSSTFSMKEFWLRRVKRILPALITVVMATLLVAPFLIFKGDIRALTIDAIAALFSYANFHAMAKFGDYWGASAESSFFLHAWSLSVEEQFYIFYPLFLIILFRLKYSLSKWLFVTMSLSLLAFVLGSIYFPTQTFYLLPTRAWEMGIGGFLAIVKIEDRSLKYKSIVAKEWLSLVGLIMILSSYFIFTGNEGINIFALLPVLGSVTIIAFSSEDNLVGRLLSSKPFVFIGKVSYSLYLWHWPIIVLLNGYYTTILTSIQIQIIAISATIILASLSYYFVENKTRKWRHTPKLVLGSLMFIIGYVFLLRSPIINKEYKSSFDRVEFYGLLYDITPHIAPISNDNREKRKGVFAPERNRVDDASLSRNGILSINSKDENPKIMVLGDSHASMWGKVIDEICGNINVNVAFYTSVGSSPFFNIDEIENQDNSRGFTKQERINYAKGFVSNLKLWKPELIIIVCKWDNLKNNKIQKFKDLLELAKVNGVKVLLLNQPPVIHTIGDKNTAQYLAFLKYKIDKNKQYIINNSSTGSTNVWLASLVKNEPNVEIFDVYSEFLSSNKNPAKSLIVQGSDILYYDDDHLSYQGTLLLKEKLNKKIVSKVIKK